MTRWAMRMTILGSVLVAGLMFGCETNQPPEDTKPYDPNIDAPPTNLSVTENPDLLADQAKLARNKPAPISGSTRTGSTGIPAANQDANTAAVRSVMGQMVSTMDSGQWINFGSFASGDDAAAFTELGKAMAALATDEKALNEAVKARQVNAPASLAQVMERGADGGPALLRIAKTPVDELGITSNPDGTVTVKGKSGDTLTFKKIEDKWVVSLTPAQRDVYTSLAELAAIQSDVAKALTKGVQSGATDFDEMIMRQGGDVINAKKDLKDKMQAAHAGG